MTIKRKLSILVLAVILGAAVTVWAGSFTSYNDITTMADTDLFLCWDASEGSGDELANISWANIMVQSAAYSHTLTNKTISGASNTITNVSLTTGVTGILPVANGGTNNAYFTVSGPATSAKTYTFPNASSTVLTSNAAVTVAQGGTGRATGTTAYSLIATGTTATGAQQTLANGATTQILVGGGASALPAWGTDIPTAATIGSAYIYRAGGTDVAIADGGTGAGTAADAFSALKQAATTSATGVSELATTAETTTGTDAARVVTPDGLSGSVYGQKEIGWTVVNADIVTAVADGLQGAAVPASMNGMNLIDVTCSVADLNSASGGNTTVVLRRVRAGTPQDMTSTGVTIAYNAYTASDETVNTSYDDVATGDMIFVDINGVTTGAVQKGLSCTAIFQTP